MTQIQQADEEIAASPDIEVIVTPELVAKTIAGISLIGLARNALQQAGWDATIVANRITVDKVVEAHLVTSNGVAWWQVYAVDGTPPVWTVGTQQDSSVNWIGCVE